MSNFKVLWSEPGSNVRHARMFDNAIEAKGFVKGLRAVAGPERVGVRFLNAEGEYARVAVADFFQATEGKTKQDG